MAPASPLLSISRCSAASRSFLHSRLPDGSPPAGAPPGHRLRSGGYMAAIRSGTKGKISPHDVSTLSGEPRAAASASPGQAEVAARSGLRQALFPITAERHVIHRGRGSLAAVAAAGDRSHPRRRGCISVTNGIPTGRAGDAASCTPRSGTPASRAAGDERVSVWLRDTTSLPAAVKSSNPDQRSVRRVAGLETPCTRHGPSVRWGESGRGAIAGA